MNCSSHLCCYYYVNELYIKAVLNVMFVTCENTFNVFVCSYMCYVVFVFVKECLNYIVNEKYLNRAMNNVMYHI